MKTEEFVQITEDSLLALLNSRYGCAKAPEPDPPHNHRRQPRWPFAGAVEVWVEPADGQTSTEDRYLLGSTLNLSASGVGLMMDEPLAPGSNVTLAIHEPEVTLFGKAVVRHCTDINAGMLVGLQFVFEEQATVEG